MFIVQAPHLGRRGRSIAEGGGNRQKYFFCILATGSRYESTTTRAHLRQSEYLSYITMNFPGGSSGAGAPTPGFGPQDPGVKAVRIPPHPRLLVSSPLTSTGSIRHGIMLRQVRHVRSHGIRHGRSFRHVHGFCMSLLPSPSYLVSRVPPPDRR